MSTKKLVTEETTPQTIIPTNYVVWLRNHLKSGDQKIIAEKLSIQYVYVKQILGGNKKKNIKSTNAIKVIQTAEKLILERIESQLETNTQVMNSIKNRLKPVAELNGVSSDL